MRKTILIIIFFVYSSVFSYATTLSFDRPFPMTWYEKGLNATMGLWHKVTAEVDTNNTHGSCVAEESVDILLGKCIFAYFCLEKMRQSKQRIITQDSDYFLSLIDRLEQEVALCCWEQEQEDQLICLEQLIATMKNCLKTPGGIDTK